MTLAEATDGMHEVIVQAVREAVGDASKRGYEAIILVLVMLGMIACTGLIIKWLVRSYDKSLDKRMEEAKAHLDEARKREERMAARLDYLETFVQSTLVKLVNDTSALAGKVLSDTSAMLATNLEAIRALTASLQSSPCMLDPARQQDVVDRIAEGVMQKIHRIQTTKPAKV